MKVCAIILNHFGHKDTIACIKELSDQSLTKIVVLENSGSEEEKQKLCTAFVEISVVEVISSKKNLGFAGGVNYVLKQMLPLGFDAFLILNNDTFAPDDLIDTLIKGAETQPLDLASPVVYCHPEQGKLWSRGNYYNTWAGLITDRPISFLPGNFFYLPGCCFLVHANVFESMGLFDENFFMYGEDVEFCFRAAKKGFKTGIVSDAKIYHKTGSSSVQNSFFYEYHINRGHFLLGHKLFYSSYARMFMQVLKTLILGIRATIRTIRYKNLNAFKGYLQARLKVPFV